jgi:hypothetical protein
MRQLEYCLPIAFALLLGACGGGGEGAASFQAADAGRGPGIAVGEPAPSGPARDEFIKLARGAECTDIRNRLFVIDNKQVFWDAQGNCPDRGYARTLYGRTAAEVQCASNDSIAGPMTSCADPAQRAVFDTILKNLDKADLGLGSAHKVEQIDFLPKDGEVLAEPLLSERFSGVSSPLNVAVRDQESFAKLWDSHYMGNPRPMPKIDFNRQMVLGVFLGNRANSCISLTLDKVEVRAGKVNVHYTEHDASGPTVLCAAVIVAPMEMVVVERIEGDVTFNKP